MIDLKKILKQHANCISSRAAFKSVLMDEYPTEKRMINILTILFECGVANRIKERKSIDANHMQALIAQVENEYGISGQYSQEAILVWAAAFDVTASSIKTSSATPLPTSEQNPTGQKPIEYVQGEVNDYDVVQKADGYYITHFNGFEEEEMTIPSMIDGKLIMGIAQDAFQGCVMVKKIHISEGIEVVENCAFKECRALEAVTLPDTLRRIGSKSTAKHGDGAFASTNLQTVIIPQNVEFIGPYTFYFCTKLQKIELPDRITTIFEGTFTYCENLSEIKLPNGLSVIERKAFVNCKKLHEIHIPVGTRTIAKDAFWCTPLNSIYIPPTVTAIGDEKDRSIFGDSTLGLSPTVYCTAGSAAMEYARKHNFKCAKAQF